MDDAHLERIARNEALFRELNEAIERGRWPGEEQEPVRFRCECARIDCNSVVKLTPRQYERVRQHPRRFILVEGHEVPQSEAIVERDREYLVVEKLGEAGATAEETDPRAEESDPLAEETDPPS